jgi:RHS repeat-associated protein
VWQANYSYDAASSLDTVKVGTADTVATISPANRLTAWTGMTFAIDSDGNRTSQTVGSTTTTYAWGSDGRLLSVTQGSNTRSYDYDPNGQLVQRKTNNTVDRYYLWENGQILAILDGTATSRVAEFVYFGGADQPLARISGPKGSATIHYYAQDVSGNVVGQFSGTTLEQSMSYDPWGATTLNHLGSDTTTAHLRWKGLLWEDGITSLYYMRARWYDPVTRRFVSPDPLGLLAGVNQYAFAGSDPINGSDPSGTCNDQLDEQKLELGAAIGHLCMGYYDLGFLGQVAYFYFEGPTLSTVDVYPTSYPPITFAMPVGDIGVGLGGPMVTYPQFGGGGDGSSSSASSLTCTGTAHIFQGNKDFVGRSGAFGVTITNNSVAVAPEQWGGRPALAPYINQVSGGVSGRNPYFQNSFSGITDVIGSNVVPHVRQFLMARYPGQLLLEFPGGIDLGARTVTLSVPQALGCPQGTNPVT